MDRKKAIEYIKWYFTKDDGMAADASVKEAIQALVPELKESEDEVHRKWILEYLYDGLRKADEQFKDHFKSAIDWLEKQKDQRNYRKLYEGIAKSEWFKKAYEGKSLGGEDEQKEQKPVNWTELNWEDIAKLEVFINNVHNEYPNGIGQESFGEEVLERFREYKEDEDLDEKDQKPDENITDEEIKLAMDDIHNFKVAVTDLAKTFNIRIDHDRDIDWHNFCASLLTYLKRYAEWSEEEKKTISFVIDVLRANHPDGFFKTSPAGDIHVTGITVEKLIKKLESLLSRFE